MVGILNRCALLTQLCQVRQKSGATKYKTWFRSFEKFLVKFVYKANKYNKQTRHTNIWMIIAKLLVNPPTHIKRDQYQKSQLKCNT